MPPAHVIHQVCAWSMAHFPARVSAGRTTTKSRLSDPHAGCLVEMHGLVRFGKAGLPRLRQPMTILLNLIQSRCLKGICCHTTTHESNKVGPTMWSIVGRD